MGKNHKIGMLIPIKGNEDRSSFALKRLNELMGLSQKDLLIVFVKDLSIVSGSVDY